MRWASARKAEALARAPYGKKTLLYRLFQTQHSFRVTIFTLGFRLFFILLQINTRVSLTYKFSQKSYSSTDDGHGWVQGDPPSVIRNGWYGWSNPPIRPVDRMV